jgi:hypothetical protein
MPTARLAVVTLDLSETRAICRRGSEGSAKPKRLLWHADPKLDASPCLWSPMNGRVCCSATVVE